MRTHLVASISQTSRDHCLSDFADERLADGTPKSVPRAPPHGGRQPDPIVQRYADGQEQPEHWQVSVHACVQGDRTAGESLDVGARRQIVCMHTFVHAS